MKINDFMSELEKIIATNGRNCQVIVALSKKDESNTNNSQLHPSMQQALKPFLQFK